MSSGALLTKNNLDSEHYGDKEVDSYVKHVEMKHSECAVTKFMNSEGRSKTILDIGCGSGYWCYQAAKLGAKSVSGFDIQEKMVEAAKKLTAQITEVDVRIGDVRNMPYNDNTFDVAFSMYVTCGLPMEVLTKHYQELYRVLVPGGKALVTYFTNHAYQRLQLNEGADERLVEDKIAQVIARLPKHPTLQKMQEAFNGITEIKRACLALDKDGSVYLVNHTSQLTNGQAIWFITSIMIFPDYFYDEQYLVDQTVDSGLCIDKIENFFGSEEIRKSYNIKYDYPAVLLYHLSKPLSQ